MNPSATHSLPRGARSTGLRMGLFFAGFMTAVFWVMDGWRGGQEWGPLLAGGLARGVLAGLLFGVAMGRMLRPLVRTVRVDNGVDFHRRLVAAARDAKYHIQEESPERLVFRPAWRLGFLSPPLVVDFAPGQATLAGPRPVVRLLLEDVGKT